METNRAFFRGRKQKGYIQIVILVQFCQTKRGELNQDLWVSLSLFTFLPIKFSLYIKLMGKTVKEGRISSGKDWGTEGNGIRKGKEGFGKAISPLLPLIR